MNAGREEMVSAEQKDATFIKVFRHIDINQDGFIVAQELKDAILKAWR